MTGTRGVILIDDPTRYERFSMPFGEITTIRIVTSSASLGTSSELVALPSWEGTYQTNLESAPLAPSSFSNRHERRKHAKVARRNSVHAGRSR